jgi:hypothetical protein
VRRALLVLCCVAMAAALAPPASAGPPTYRPPVDAPVRDPFRAPATRYGPGNRGLEYATPPGMAVRVVADGVVTFAGSVGGTRHVTVLHADGVRTTYSFLARVEVVVGQRLRQGTRVGTTAGSLHLGARRGDAYFDPASLFSAAVPEVRLVPFDDPPGRGPGSERSAISQLVGGVGGLLQHAGGAMGDWLRGTERQLQQTIGHYASRVTMPGAMLDASLTMRTAWHRARRAASRPCTRDHRAVAAPAERRVALLVAGLGSHSARSTIDQVQTSRLGYAPADVLRFSYAGGRVPDPTDRFATIPATTYDAPATQLDLRATATRLADLVEAVAADAPGVPIDLLAHSQGGVVVRLALIELEVRHGAAWLSRLGLVATLGSPHGGADLATAIHALSSTRSGAVALDAFSTGTDQELDHDGPSVAQLSETSDVVRELAAHPVPATVPAVSIAARGDVIVPVPRTEAPGMTQVVVPLVGRDAHSDLPASPEATRALQLALAGLPPGCQSLGDALADQAAGHGISLLEDLAGAAGLLAALDADVQVVGARH